MRGNKDLEDSAEARATILADQLGWFFVLQEMVSKRALVSMRNVRTSRGDRVWDNLSWENIDLAGKPVIDLSRPFILPLGGTQTGGHAWNSNAGDIAAILYQKPVMIAVHGREMLDRNALPGDRLMPIDSGKFADLRSRREKAEGALPRRSAGRRARR